MNVKSHNHLLGVANTHNFIVSYDSQGNPYSYYFDDEWIMWTLNISVKFNRLTGRFKDCAKHVAYKILTKSSGDLSNTVMHNFICGAIIFEKCITSCGGGSYEFLDDDKGYRLVLEAAKSKKLKTGTWKNYLIFISHIYREDIIKRDIGVARELVNYLSVNGSTGEVIQTMCLPEEVADKYYREALCFVDTYHPHRHNISESYKEFIAEYERLSKVYKSNFSIRKNAIKNTSSLPGDVDISLDYSGLWLSKLRGACYIVIAAFTGCRSGEVKSLNIHSYQEKKYAGMIIPVVNGVHTKANPGGVERSTSWITIPSVKKAIELVWDSFSFARNHWFELAEAIEHDDKKKIFLNSANGLFISLPHYRSLYPGLGRQGMTDSIHSFLKTVNYLATENDVKEFDLLNPSRSGEVSVGDKIMPHPHAFRRTFAVFLVRNKLASLLDIKYQFKHMNIAMTSWYANQANVASYFDMMMDDDLKEEIAIENQEYMANTLYYIYNEAETLAGPEGKRIYNLRVEGDSEIYLNKDEIREQVKQGRLSIVEHPGGYCTNPSCDRICDMTTCQYKVVTKEKAIELMAVRDKLINKHASLILNDIDLTNIISKIYFEIRSIEKTLSEHKLDYKPFNRESIQL